jgi:hypothetical protein
MAFTPPIYRFDPELIELALFTLMKAALEALPGNPFKKISRVARIWATTGIENQPAAFLVPLGASIIEDQAYSVPKYVLQYAVLVYTRAEDGPDNVPQILLNQCWKAVNDALRATPPGSPQTLGGLVVNAWIEGQVTMQSGILDKQCALEIPVHAIVGL